MPVNLSIPALLHLHRSAFIVALREHAADPLKHKFSPSVLVVHQYVHLLFYRVKSISFQGCLLSDYGHPEASATVFGPCA